MKKIIVLVAALALSVGPAMAWGAHNPTTVDHPDVPNCTLFGAITYENTPSCETIIYTGSASLVGATAHFRAK